MIPPADSSMEIVCRVDTTIEVHRSEPISSTTNRAAARRSSDMFKSAGPPPLGDGPPVPYNMAKDALQAHASGSGFDTRQTRSFSCPTSQPATRLAVSGIPSSSASTMAIDSKSRILHGRHSLGSRSSGLQRIIEKPDGQSKQSTKESSEPQASITHPARTSSLPAANLDPGFFYARRGSDQSTRMKQNAGTPGQRLARRRLILTYDDEPECSTASSLDFSEHGIECRDFSSHDPTQTHPPLKLVANDDNLLHRLRASIPQSADNDRPAFRMPEYGKSERDSDASTKLPMQDSYSSDPAHSPRASIQPGHEIQIPSHRQEDVHDSMGGRLVHLHQNRLPPSSVQSNSTVVAESRRVSSSTASTSQASCTSSVAMSRLGSLDTTTASECSICAEETPKSADTSIDSESPISVDKSTPTAANKSMQSAHSVQTGHNTTEKRKNACTECSNIATSQEDQACKTPAVSTAPKVDGPPDIVQRQHHGEQTASFTPWKHESDTCLEAFKSKDEPKMRNYEYGIRQAERAAKWSQYMIECGLSNAQPIAFPISCGKTQRFVRKGVPADWRGAAWFHYAGGAAYLSRHPLLYTNLVELSTRLVNRPDKAAIDRDLGRISLEIPNRSMMSIKPTKWPIQDDLPKSSKQHYECLRRIMRAFAQHKPQTEYCSRLCLIAHTLLSYLSEEKVFWMLHIITTVHLPHLLRLRRKEQASHNLNDSHDLRDMHDMNEFRDGENDIAYDMDTWIFMTALKRVDSKLYKKFKRLEQARHMDHDPFVTNHRPHGDINSRKSGIQIDDDKHIQRNPKSISSGIDTSAISSNSSEHFSDPQSPLSVQSLITTWLSSLFMNELPLETVLRIWDILFYEGGSSTILIRISLALLKIIVEPGCFAEDTTGVDNGVRNNEQRKRLTATSSSPFPSRQSLRARTRAVTDIENLLKLADRYRDKISHSWVEQQKARRLGSATRMMGV